MDPPLTVHVPIRDGTLPKLISNLPKSKPGLGWFAPQSNFGYHVKPPTVHEMLNDSPWNDTSRLYFGARYYGPNVILDYNSRQG